MSVTYMVRYHNPETNELLGTYDLASVSAAEIRPWQPGIPVLYLRGTGSTVDIPLSGHDVVDEVASARARSYLEIIYRALVALPHQGNRGLLLTYVRELETIGLSAGDTVD